MNRRKILLSVIMVLLVAALLCTTALAADGEDAGPSMYGSFWALIPPIVAIALALITKQAYLSLCVAAAMLYEDKQ